MARTSMGRTRPVDRPYLIFESAEGPDGEPGWTWKVLKAYGFDPLAPYARWFCAVSSPLTRGSYDLGDTYCSEVMRGGHLTYRDPVVGDREVGLSSYATEGSRNDLRGDVAAALGVDPSELDDMYLD